MNYLKSDIDIDVPDRSLLLDNIWHIPACIKEHGVSRKHNSGIYVTDIPKNYSSGISAIDYRQAESRGYFKLDLLNVSLYKNVKDENHLIELMKEPDWKLLEDKTVVEKITHIHSHWDVLQMMPEPVNSIPRLAMFLAIIRPAKRKLVGLPWKEVAKTIWEPDPMGRYTFKKSHSIAYATLVVVSMNLYRENPEAFVSPEL